jgi:hypothetical protein
VAKSRIAEAYVQLVPTATGFKEAISKEIDGPLNDTAKNATEKFRNMGGVLAAGLATAAIGAWAKTSIDALQRIETINAQTSSALESTGAQAWISASQVEELAGSLERLTSTEAESIQEGANLLLTFKNIQNQAGEGNDIFNQATTAMVDMSRAMGTDASSGAIQLGKALNDPTAGISALSRVGITFTEDQKDMIKSLQDSGDMMGAQKIILEELNSQFGGSGEAYAQTYAGQVEQLGHQMGTLGETIFSSLMPALEGIVGAATPFFEFLNENPVLVQAMAIALGVLAAAMIAMTVANWAMTTSVWANTAALLANPLTWIVLAVVAAVALLIAAIVAIVQNWDVIVAWLDSVFGPAIEAIGNWFTWLWEDIIQPVMTFVGDIFTWIWETIILPVFSGIMLYIGLVAALFTWLWENAVQPAFKAIGQMFEWIWKNVISPIIGYIVGVINGLGMVFNWLYNNVVKPVFEGLGMAFNWIWKNVIKPVVDFITGALENIGTVVSTVFGFVATFIKNTFDGIIGVIRGPVNAVIGFINTLISGLNKIKIDIPDWVPEWGGKTIGFNIAKIPMLAEGGTIQKPGSVMVGEEGPEILSLPRGAQVTPLDKVGGGTIIYNAAPNVSIDSEQALFTAMRRAKVVAGW